MTIAAKITPTEVTEIVRDRYVDKVYQVRLINAPGVSYIPGTTVDADFLAFEVPVGTGGYQRQVFSYVTDDLTAYTDDGVALATKATVFTHDGGTTPTTFSHACMVESDGSILTLGPVTAIPASGVPGTYSNTPCTTSGSGVNATVDIVVTNDGENIGDWAVTLNTAGYGYAAGDTLTVAQDVLRAGGIIAPTETGDLVLTAATATSNDSSLVSVALSRSAHSTV